MHLTFRGYLTVALAATLAVCIETDTRRGTDLDALGRIEALANTSNCAARLLDQIQFQGNCSTNDVTCLCDAGLADIDAFKWLLANCAFPEALVSHNVTTSACELPVRDMSTRYAVIVIVTNTVTGLFMVARLLHARYISSRGAFSWDDWITLAMICVSIPSTVVNIARYAPSGLGRDIWTLTLPEISEFAFYLYIMTLFYVSIMMLLKLTFCFLYMRIFPSATLRRLLWGTIVFHILFGFATFISSIFTCTPINYIWRRYSQDVQGHCISISGLFWTYGAIIVAGDIWLLALPLRPVLNLNLHWKKKVAVSIMLLTGSLATIISIIRFRAVFSYLTSINATYDAYAFGIWSDFEFSVGAICVCLPSIRLLLARTWPRFFGGSEMRTSRATSQATVDRAAQEMLKADSRTEYIRVGYTELAPLPPAKRHYADSRSYDNADVLPPPFLTTPIPRGFQ